MFAKYTQETYVQVSSSSASAVGVGEAATVEKVVDADEILVATAATLEVEDAAAVEKVVGADETLVAMAATLEAEDTVEVEAVTSDAALFFNLVSTHKLVRSIVQLLLKSVHNGVVCWFAD